MNVMMALAGLILLVAGVLAVQNNSAKSRQTTTTTVIVFLGGAGLLVYGLQMREKMEAARMVSMDSMHQGGEQNTIYVS